MRPQRRGTVLLLIRATLGGYSRNQFPAPSWGNCSSLCRHRAPRRTRCILGPPIACVHTRFTVGTRRQRASASLSLAFVSLVSDLTCTSVWTPSPPVPQGTYSQRTMAPWGTPASPMNAVSGGSRPSSRILASRARRVTGTGSTASHLRLRCVRPSLFLVSSIGGVKRGREEPGKRQCVALISVLVVTGSFAMFRGLSRTPRGLAPWCAEAAASAGLRQIATPMLTVPEPGQFEIRDPRDGPAPRAYAPMAVRHRQPPQAASHPPPLVPREHRLRLRMKARALRL